MRPEGGLDQEDSNTEGKKQVETGLCLKVEPAEFFDMLDVGFKKEREVWHSSTVSLRNQQCGSEITEGDKNGSRRCVAENWLSVVTMWIPRYLLHMGLWRRTESGLELPVWCSQPRHAF